MNKNEAAVKIVTIVCLTVGVVTYFKLLRSLRGSH